MTDPCDRHGRVRCDECREVEELKEAARWCYDRLAGDNEFLGLDREALASWPWLADTDRDK